MVDSFLGSVLECDSLLIVTHARPDGDAIGSQLALGRFLLSCGKDVILAGSDDTPRNLAWLDPDGLIEVFDGSPLQVVRFNEQDGVEIVDANAPARTGSLGELVSNHRGRLFVVDHHPDPEDCFDAMAVDTSAASTGQLVYDLIKSHDHGRIDQQAAVCLYTAIMTDTGSFRYGSVTPELMRTVAELLHYGAFTVEEVYNLVYQTRTEAGQLLLGEALQTLKLTNQDRLGYIKITRRMFERTGSTSDDVDAFTDHVLAIRGVRAAILFMEVGQGVKMSFRSQGDIAVNGLAEMFGGGGHKNASGAFALGSIDTIVERVLDAATQFMPTPNLSVRQE